MDKMQYPRGLIRYDTQNGLQQHLSRGEEVKRVLRPRVIVYSVILVVVSSAVLASLVLRTPFKVDVVRDRASLARIVDEGRIENVYRLQIMNASEQTQHYRIEVEGDKLDDARIVGNNEVDVGPAQARWVPVVVQVPDKAAREAGPGAHPIEFEITQQPDSNGKTWERKERSSFVVPR
jgi:polyferredoxin